jgi:membrane-bound inhibitor of C-type lysozyme
VKIFLAWTGVLFALPAAADVDLVTVRYKCERGVEVPATYVNAAEGSVVVLNVEGQQITLRHVPAASGARYEWPSDGSGYVWWTKGAEASLFWKDAEKGEEVTLFALCAEKP